MLTISALAKQLNISRSTLLYYERQGLITPKLRSDNGYRWYGEQEVSKLKSIIAYRSYGIPVNQITTLLAQHEQQSQQQVLTEQFNAIEREINKLRQQQKAIVMLLEQPELLEQEMVTKDKWVEIMRAAGFNDQDMHNWHIQFEKLEPEAHQEFLESLSIEQEEIKQIREWSQQ